MNEFLEEMLDDFGFDDIEDKLVEQNHEFIEEFNKKKHFKIKMPLGYGTKAS